MNFTTTIFTDLGSKLKVSLCLVHRHNRVFAGYVYGARRLKSDGQRTDKPCYDCEAKASGSAAC